MLRCGTPQVAGRTTEPPGWKNPKYEKRPKHDRWGASPPELVGEASAPEAMGNLRDHVRPTSREPRPVVPRDAGPQSALAGDGDGEGGSLLANMWCRSPGSQGLGEHKYTCRPVSAGVFCKVECRGHPCLKRAKVVIYGLKAPESSKDLTRGSEGELGRTSRDASGCHGKRPSESMVIQGACLRPRQAGYDRGWNHAGSGTGWSALQWMTSCASGAAPSSQRMSR